MECHSIPESLLFLLAKLDEHGETVSHHHQHEITLANSDAFLDLQGEGARRSCLFTNLISDINETESQDHSQLKRSP